MQENCQSGSEGGAKRTFVPTPILTAERTPVSAPGPAEPLPPRPKTTSLVSQSAPKPAFLSEGQPAARLEEEIGKRIEPQRAGALASFVASLGNDLLKDAPPPERRQPQGYITVESKPESFAFA